MFNNEYVNSTTFLFLDAHLEFDKYEVTDFFFFLTICIQKILGQKCRLL